MADQQNESIQERALRLLKAIKARPEHGRSRQPNGKRCGATFGTPRSSRIALTGYSYDAVKIPG
jgi:hypothetical protein